MGHMQPVIHFCVVCSSMPKPLDGVAVMPVPMRVGACRCSDRTPAGLPDKAVAGTVASLLRLKTSPSSEPLSVWQCWTSNPCLLK